ncbi:MAG: hypothetical protein K8S18_01370, partial [Desulfobacula sp.]|nr:hypothetical protein [Desulfobacula sp.]
MATLISHKLLKIDLLGIICNLFIDLIGGNIIIPKWFAVLTILLIIFLAALCFSLNYTFFSVLKWIFAAFKNKKIVDIDELIKSKSIPENIRLDILGYQNNDPSMIFKKNICIKSFKPGTFTLAEISP